MILLLLAALHPHHALPLHPPLFPIDRGLQAVRPYLQKNTRVTIRNTGTRTSPEYIM